MDYKELKSLGLAEKEAKVYLAALELGQSTVQKISEKAKVNRATTYVVIESLMQKGLVSSVHEDKKQYFYAESPEKLSILFREQAIEIQQKQEYLEKILPSLRALKSQDKEGPVVRYFEGKEGMRAMAEEFFLVNHDEPARMIYSVDLLNDIFSLEEKIDMRNRRKDKKIKVRSIINDEKGKHDSGSECLKLPASEYKITSDIAFFDNRVRIATQKGDLKGIIIENREISETFKILYDLAWKYLELKNKKGPKK